MSAQEGTLARRGAVHLPIWPVATLLVVAVAAAIGLKVIDDVRPGEAVTSIQETEGYWDSTVGHPVLRGRGGLVSAVREQPAVAIHVPGRAHEVVFGAQASGITYVTGLENPGVYPTDGPAGPPEQPSYWDCDYCHQRL
jgi:hypothetical protein